MSAARRIRVIFRIRPATALAAASDLTAATGAAMERYTMIVALSGQLCGTLLIISLISAFVIRRRAAPLPGDTANASRWTFVGDTAVDRGSRRRGRAHFRRTTVHDEAPHRA